VFSFRALAEMLEEFSPKFLIPLIENILSKKSYSVGTYGEDLLLDAILKRAVFEKIEVSQLSYLDIGAWRPISGSNTFKMYQRGIRGTVVEPNPHFKKLWRACRPGDQYLEVGCSNDLNAELIIFHKSAASNTLSSKFAKTISRTQGFLNQEKIKVACFTLNEIVQKHKDRFPGEYILDLDIEGLDFEVLNSFDFQDNLRPLLIMVEDFQELEASIIDTTISHLLMSHNYKLISRSVITSIFVDSTHPISRVGKMNF